MSYSQYSGARITFHLPIWIMEERFSRPPNIGEHRDGNIIEDKLFEHPAVKEVCLNHQVWVEAEFNVQSWELHDRIELFHQCLERTLKTFDKQRRAHHAN